MFPWRLLETNFTCNINNCYMRTNKYFHRGLRTGREIISQKYIKFTAVQSRPWSSAQRCSDAQSRQLQYAEQDYCYGYYLSFYHLSYDDNLMITNSGPRYEDVDSWLHPCAAAAYLRTVPRVKPGAAESVNSGPRVRQLAPCCWGD